MKSEDAKAIFLLEYCAEECDGYQKDDTCENCEINAAIEALDKQIPKKPIFEREQTSPFGVDDVPYCPNCRCDLPEVSYCEKCGQRILWEAEE